MAVGEGSFADRADSSRLPLSKPHDYLFIGLLVSAAALRLYYFNLTQDQPLWWDEAVYLLKAKALVFGTPETGWDRSRPVLLSFIAALFFKIGLNESALRLVWVFLSTASLFLIYRIGGALFHPRVGLYAAAFAGVFSLDLFYSMRLLVDAPQVFFVLLGASLMVSSLRDEKRRSRALAVFPVLFIGAALRFTVAVFLAVVGIFLAVAKGKAVFKEKEWRISAVLGVLLFLPFLFYFWNVYGNPLQPFLAATPLRLSPSAPGRPRGTAGHVFLQYVSYFPNYTHPFVVALFLGGMLYGIAAVALRFRGRRTDKAAQAHLLLLLWIVVPFVFFGFFVDHFEDRYLAMIFPAVFLMAGVALDAAYLCLKRYGRAAALVAVAAVLAYSEYRMLRDSDSMIRGKIESYRDVRDIGAWIKEHSDAADTVVASSVPQITYYAERSTFKYPNREGDFDNLLRRRRPKYMVLSVWERSPKWVYGWPDGNPDKVSVAAVLFFDQDRKQLSTAAFEFGGAR